MLATIKQILDLPEGKTDTFDVEGVIKTSYKQDTKTGKFGDFTIQNLVLTDGKNDIKVSLFDCKNIPQSANGSHVVIENVQNTLYKGEQQIKATKKSTVTVTEDEEVEFGDSPAEEVFGEKPAPKAKATMDDLIVNALVEAGRALIHPEVIQARDDAKEAGYDEDTWFKTGMSILIQGQKR